MVARQTREKSTPLKLSYVAIAAFILAVVGLGVFAVNWPRHWSGHLRPEEMLKLTVFCVAALGAFILGCIAWTRTESLASGTLRGRRLACLAIVLALVSIGSAVVERLRSSRVPPEARCGPNMSGLGKAMMVYAGDYNVLPVADRWCDLLIDHAEVDPTSFVCPVSDAARGQSSYAMNESAAGRSVLELPPDLVLLFESRPGWNQLGGRELLATEKHGGEGAHVLLVDGHVEFVKAEKLAALKWQDAGMQLPEARDSQQENREESDE